MPTIEKKEAKISYNPIYRKNLLARLDRKKRASIIIYKQKSNKLFLNLLKSTKINRRKEARFRIVGKE